MACRKSLKPSLRCRGSFGDCVPPVHRGHGDRSAAAGIVGRHSRIGTLTYTQARSVHDRAYADTLATVAAGRTALVERLRAIAARVEAFPLDATAEVLVLLEPAMATFEQHAILALERAPTRAMARNSKGALANGGTVLQCRSLSA